MMTDTDMRDCINHVSHFGNGAVVHKMGGKWFISFREFGFPQSFKTKREAMERVGDWVCALSARRRELALAA